MNESRLGATLRKSPIMPASWQALSVRARTAFTARFGGEPTALACAPGRVELLGNHTDYNGGLVMAAAVDRTTVVAGRRMAGRQASVFSINFGQDDAYSLDEIERTEAGAWTRYVRGVCWALTRSSGSLSSGFEAVVVGDVPLGAGLSSSASLQASVAWFLIQLGVVPDLSSPDFDGNHSDPLRMELAKTLRRSENDFVGVGSGLLDQFSSLFGRAGHALFLDCDTLAHDRLPLGTPTPAIVVCDSKTSRRLADGMYDQRRAECDRVAAVYRDRIPHQGEFALSQVSIDQLETDWDRLDPVGRKRARHVLSENERVRRGVAALKANDVVAFGRLMSASHVSSRDDFANSSPALDRLIEAAEAAPGFLGGKLSGAGWAGCTVNLVRVEKADEFAEVVRTVYARKTGDCPEIHICRADDGAFGVDFMPKGL
jgi:galactokinase